ncbi:MAG: RluA family pseudouridine synthase [Halanaerobiales bacterium]
MKKILLYVNEEEDGDRIDVFLANNTDMSRSRIQKLIKKDQVELNNNINKKASTNVNVGDKVLLNVTKPEEYAIRKQNIDIDIIYQDFDIIIVNKPVGMVVHPSPGHKDGTLVNALLYKCRDLSGINGVLRPGIVHRLDKDTSGVMVVAKNDFSHVSLSAQFKQKTINKTYLAMVYGRVKSKEGKIKTFIGRDPHNRLKMSVLNNRGKIAITHYKVVKYFGDYTLLNINLETGRTHQIRVHMDYLGYPIIGDETYGNKNSLGAFSGSQFLHAKNIEFYHPRKQKRVKFSATLPRDRIDFLKRLKNTSQG